MSLKMRIESVALLEQHGIGIGYHISEKSKEA